MHSSNRLDRDSYLTMSFGRGGRGGGSNSFSRNLPFGLSYGDVGVNETTEFPSIPLPANNPNTGKERTVAVAYINFMKTVKDGPFYTGSMALSVDSSDKKKKVLIDEDGVNDGIERYSDKYLKKRKIGASIDEHPYHLEIFPPELYQVMGINKKKLLALSNFNKRDDIFTGSGSKNDETEGLSMLEKLKELAEDDDEAANNENKEENNDVEDVDDDFDDEDDDDDYNAEKYFDDGDDDFGGEEEYADEPAF